jgi:hypothetical protein
MPNRVSEVRIYAGQSGKQQYSVVVRNERGQVVVNSVGPLGDAKIADIIEQALKTSNETSKTKGASS